MVEIWMGVGGRRCELCESEGEDRCVNSAAQVGGFACRVRDGVAVRRWRSWGVCVGFEG